MKGVNKSGYDKNTSSKYKLLNNSANFKEKVYQNNTRFNNKIDYFNNDDSSKRQGGYINNDNFGKKSDFNYSKMQSSSHVRYEKQMDNSQKLMASKYKRPNLYEEKIHRVKKDYGHSIHKHDDKRELQEKIKSGIKALLYNYANKSDKEVFDKRDLLSSALRKSFDNNGKHKTERVFKHHQSSDDYNKYEKYKPSHSHDYKIKPYNKFESKPFQKLSAEKDSHQDDYNTWKAKKERALLKSKYETDKKSEFSKKERRPYNNFDSNTKRQKHDSPFVRHEKSYDKKGKPTHNPFESVQQTSNKITKSQGKVYHNPKFQASSKKNVVDFKEREVKPEIGNGNISDSSDEKIDFEGKQLAEKARLLGITVEDFLKYEEERQKTEEARRHYLAKKFNDDRSFDSKSDD